MTLDLDEPQMSEAEKMAERLEERADLGDFGRKPDLRQLDRQAAALIRRLVAEKAKLVEAARPFAYLVEGDFYPTECEVERLRAAIERIQ
jgi:hypothetical protein